MISLHFTVGKPEMYYLSLINDKNSPGISNWTKLSIKPDYMSELSDMEYPAKTDLLNLSNHGKTTYILVDWWEMGLQQIARAKHSGIQRRSRSNPSSHFTRKRVFGSIGSSKQKCLV